MKIDVKDYWCHENLVVLEIYVEDYLQYLIHAASLTMLLLGYPPPPFWCGHSSCMAPN